MASFADFEPLIINTKTERTSKSLVNFFFSQCECVVFQLSLFFDDIDIGGKKFKRYTHVMQKKERKDNSIICVIKEQYNIWSYSLQKVD